MEGDEKPQSRAGVEVCMAIVAGVPAYAKWQQKWAKLFLCSNGWLPSRRDTSKTKLQRKEQHKSITKRHPWSNARLDI